MRHLFILIATILSLLIEAQATDISTLNSINNYSGSSTSTSVANGKSSQHFVGPIKNFCVQSFNAFTPLYASLRSLRLTLLADALLKDDCDVLQFQEIWTEGLYKTFIRTLHAKGTRWRGTHMNVVTPEGQDEASGHNGLATFTRERASDIKTYVYPVNYDITFSPAGALEWVREKTNTKKAVSVVKAKGPDGMSDIYYVNTHTHPHSQKVRIAQIIFLLELIEQLLHEDIPVVLTGDFNAQPDSVEMNLLRDLLQAKDTLKWSKDCTYCANNPHYMGLSLKGKRLDYILTINSKSKQIKTLRSEINLKTHYWFHLSDHYGVRADLLLEDASHESVPLEAAHARRNRALNTIKEAAKILSSNYHEPNYRASYLYLLELNSRIKNNDESDLLRYKLAQQD